MTRETRDSIKQEYDDLLAPQPLMNRMALRTRGLVFGLTSRLAYNYALEPDLTRKVLEEFTFEDFLDRITSQRLLTGLLRQGLVQSISNLIVCAELSRIRPGKDPIGGSPNEELDND